MKSLLCHAATAVSLVLLAPAAPAQQEWPSKPIGIISANSPGAAQAQSPARYGLAPAISAPPRVLPAPQPLILVRSHPVYVGAGNYRPASTPPGNASARGPYLTGPGQWAPNGPVADTMALPLEPGDSRATPAAASGHWDWKRVSLAELVELSRRNKAARTTDY